MITSEARWRFTDINLTWKRSIDLSGAEDALATSR